jgi:multidrug resistance efflux pump
MVHIVMFYRQTLLRSLATLLVILIILAGIYALWLRYQVEPVTRDGKLRADMVPVSPDVSGLVTDVRVADNQVVRKGDILFVIDRPRYQLALDQAEATLACNRPCWRRPRARTAATAPCPRWSPPK